MSEAQVTNVRPDSNTNKVVASERRLKVLQLVDTLDMGGTERVAVNLANQLDQLGHQSYLCTTRRDGPLSSMISPKVNRLSLSRRRTIDWKAIKRLRCFVRDNDIQIVHAHGTSIVTANLALKWSKSPRIVWHDHFGTNDSSERPLWLYRLLVRRVSGIVAVSDPLAQWSRRRLKFPKERVWCVPNFVDSIPASHEACLDLPGQAGSRIVCVANIRPVKDHQTLLSAMSHVIGERADAHLILVGGLSDDACVAAVRHQLQAAGLSDHVTIMGLRDDVPQLLTACDLGVLSSTSEGLPISLLEYGAAGLAPIVTDVGQCAEVVGDTGRVLPSKSPVEMAEQILALLNDNDLRRTLGDRFRERVHQNFGVEPIMKQWTDIYRIVLASK
ncbi:MAG: glycosyltransferase family 4 protein [Rubripirellula sp.]